MIQDRKSKKGAAAGLIFAAVVLVLVVLLENLSSLLPSVPAVLQPTSQLFTVLKKGAVYSLVAVSMNLLNGFTGLFSLGQAGFMMIGAYTYAILTIPVESRAAVYQYFDGGIVQFCLPMIVALILAGVVPMIFAWLIGLPVLKLKSDYLAIATLGFAEIMRAIIQWKQVGPLTNASNLLKKFANFDSVLFPFIISAICIGIIVLIINSTYGRAFKAIRDDEIAAGASGLNTTYLKVLVFAISAFFAGIAGGIFAQYIGSLNPTMAGWLNSINYVIMVVFGGMGSLTGSIVSAIGLTILPELLRAFADYRMLAYSVVLVLVMIFRPQGIFGSWEFSLPRLVNRMLFRGAAGKGAKPAASAKQHDQSDDKTVKEASR